MLAESRQGMPSYVTEDLTQAAAELTQGKNSRADEREHLSMRRLPQHRRRHQTSCGNANMNALTYRRASTAGVGPPLSISIADITGVWRDSAISDHQSLDGVARVRSILRRTKGRTPWSI